MNYYKAIILYFIISSVALSDDNSFKIKNNKNTTPDIVIKHSGEQLALYLTGQTVRKKYFLDIYSMAHYIGHQLKHLDLSTSTANNMEKIIYKNILKHEGVKQISMVFKRNLSAEQIQTSLRSGIQLNCAKNEYLQILPQVNKFMQAIYADISKGDEFTIQWFPDGSIISLFQGKQISLIKNKKFAKTLWAIWFGENSVVDRKALIQGLLISS